jgi:ADP-ribosylglycohydrolase
MREEKLEDVIQSAIAFGNDTDTTACVAGGLAGIRFGLQMVPRLCLENLRGFDSISTVLAQLIGHLQS